MALYIFVDGGFDLETCHHLDRVDSASKCKFCLPEDDVGEHVECASAANDWFGGAPGSVATHSTRVSRLHQFTKNG